MSISRKAVAMTAGAAIGAAVGVVAGYAVDRFVIESRVEPDIDDVDTKELDAAADALAVQPQGAFVPNF